MISYIGVKHSNELGMPYCPYSAVSISIRYDGRYKIDILISVGRRYNTSMLAKRRRGKGGRGRGGEGGDGATRMEMTEDGETIHAI